MDVFTLLDEIQTIARNGLAHVDNPFDRERYERLHALATRSFADRLALTDTVVRGRFERELGYLTPKVGADAAIFDDDERLLVERCSDDGRWGLIAGWVEPGESPADTVVREAREETGLTISVLELVDVIGRQASLESGPHAMVAAASRPRRPPRPPRARPSAYGIQKHHGRVNRWRYRTAGADGSSRTSRWVTCTSTRWAVPSRRPTTAGSRC